MLKFFTTKNLTVVGVCVILGALSAAGAAQFDGDPTTNIDWAALYAALSAGVAMVMGKGAASTGGVVPETPEAAKRVEG